MASAGAFAARIGYVFLMRRAAALLLALVSAGCVQGTASFPGSGDSTHAADTRIKNDNNANSNENHLNHTNHSPGDASHAKFAAPENHRGPAPLAGAPFIELDVPNHGPAVVSVPLGATSRRPVLVAAHGAGDRPEWQCHVWRGIVGDRAFVLCPRGFPTNPYVPPDHTGYFYTTHHALGREIALAFEALAERFPDYVDREKPVFAGFSQGAIMGALLLPHHSVRFARAALVEGGYGFFQEWNIHAAQTWARQGGVRALLACGRLRCAEQAALTAYYMKRGGLAARVLYAEGAGHSYGGRMEIALREAFAWLAEGDPRFADETPKSSP